MFFRPAFFGPIAAEICLGNIYRYVYSPRMESHLLGRSACLDSFSRTCHQDERREMPSATIVAD